MYILLIPIFFFKKMNIEENHIVSLPFSMPKVLGCVSERTVKEILQVSKTKIN